MRKTGVEAFADYEVYVHGEDGKVETICLCNSHEMASVIAKRLVMGAEKPNIKVYVSGVYYGGEFIPGGGWYDVYWRDEDGKLRSGGVS